MNNLILTKDGSHTIFSKEINENYHSKHGAISESLHVFIKNGLEKVEKKSIELLEIGFGTGLNAFLSQNYVEVKKIFCNYHSIEKFPINKEQFKNLNYPKTLGIDKKKFIDLHDSNWNSLNKLSEYFNLMKIKKDILDYKTNLKFDIIFFDAFSPEKQAEMWSEEILKKMFTFLKKKGFLVTYCAKGIIKRKLKEVGFKVISLPGPIGKREMTMAMKI